MVGKAQVVVEADVEVEVGEVEVQAEVEVAVQAEAEVDVEDKSTRCLDCSILFARSRVLNTQMWSG